MKNGSSFLMFFFICMPLLTLAHEFGHALLPLIRGDQVQIYLGTTEGLTAAFGRLQITYGSPWTASAGWTHWSGDDSVLAMILGPVTSLLCTVCLFYFLKTNVMSAFWNSIVAYCAYFSLCGFLLTAIPVRYPMWFPGVVAGKVSDAYHVIELLMK